MSGEVLRAAQDRAERVHARVMAVLAVKQIRLGDDEAVRLAASLRRIATRHAPGLLHVGVGCHRCLDDTGYAATWPCLDFREVAEAAGIALPDHMLNGLVGERNETSPQLGLVIGLSRRHRFIICRANRSWPGPRVAFRPMDPLNPTRARLARWQLRTQPRHLVHDERQAERSQASPAQRPDSGQQVGSSAVGSGAHHAWIIRPHALAAGVSTSTAGAAMDVSVSSYAAGAWMIVGVAGEVDAHTAPHLRAELVNLVNGGHHHLIVDLQEVAFLDSTGLGVFVGTLRKVSAHDGVLRLVCTREPILKLFRITGLDKVFPLRTSIVQALADPVAAG